MAKKKLKKQKLPAAAKPSRREPYSEMVLLRMRPSVIAKWREYAEECDRNLSDWIRVACEHAMAHEIGMDDE